MKIDTVIPESLLKYKGPLIGKEKKNKVGGLPLPDIKLPIIKIKWFGCKNRQKNQCKRIVSITETNISGQVVFDQGDITVQWGKECPIQ